MILTGRIRVWFKAYGDLLPDMDAVCFLEPRGEVHWRHPDFALGAIKFDGDEMATGIDEGFMVDLYRIPPDITAMRLWCRLFHSESETRIHWKITASDGAILAASDQAPFNTEGPRLERRGRQWHLVEPAA